MHRRKPHCKACRSPMQGHKRINGIIICPGDLPDTYRWSLERGCLCISDWKTRMMPCSIDPDIWIEDVFWRNGYGEFIEFEEVMDDDDDVEVCEDESQGEPDGFVAEDAGAHANEDEDQGPTQDDIAGREEWPIAASYVVSSDRVADAVKGARDGGLHAVVLSQNQAEHQSLLLVIGIDAMAVRELCERHQKSGDYGQSHSDRRALARRILKLMVAGLWGGLAMYIALLWT